MGVNVLLHGDGGQSFVDFPNQAVQNNLMGVVVLAPNQKKFWGGGSGLDRTDGVAHAAAVNSLIQDQMSQDVAFDPGNVFFTGVSGGSLLMSGFFVPAFGAQYKTGVVLNCGGMAPQVPVVDANTMITSMKIHFQSTKDELALLQDSIPQSVTAYEKLATNAGLSADQVGALQTVDNTPNGGGHCGFDGKGFVSGIQLVANSYDQIMGTNASGVVTGIKSNVLTVSNAKRALSSADTNCPSSLLSVTRKSCSRALLDAPQFIIYSRHILQHIFPDLPTLSSVFHTATLQILLFQNF